MDLPWLVEELLPHSRSMVLIDDAIEAGADWVLAGVRIGEDSPFYDPELGGVPSWVGIEYMAQTVALFSGIQTKRAAREIKVGLLVGVRRYQAETVRFPLGAYLRTGQPRNGTIGRWRSSIANLAATSRWLRGA